MIRQICLNCYKTVELPDDAAGKEAACPNCGKMISVPPKYAAGVADDGGLSATIPLPPTHSPGPKPGASKMSADPSVPPGLKVESLPPPPPPPADGLTHGFGFALSPTWLDWVPAGCILLAFVLTFFPWVEMKLGGYTVMTQNGWETVFASKGENLPKGTGKESEKKEWENLDKGMAGRADDARYDSAVLRTDWLILLYLLALILLIVLLAAERLIRDPAAFPATASMTFLPPLWKWRLAAIGVLAVVVFLLVCLQSFAGFSLQRSIDAFAKFDVKDSLATNPTEAQKRELWVKAGQIAGAYSVHQTLWLNLLLVLHALAVVALAARFWLDTRGAKPLPRLDVRW